MTDTQTKPATEPDRLSLSVTQVLASVLAAVSASVAASVFGVAGTVIGAGLGSAITVIGSAIYSLSLRRSRNAVRRTLDVAVARRFGLNGADGSDGSGDSDPDAAPRRRAHRLRLAMTPQRLALGAGGLFVLTLALITTFELLTGQPVAATVTGNQGDGATVFGGTESKNSSTSPVPSVSQSPSSVPISSSASQPASDTASASSSSSSPAPTVTVTETPSATPSSTASPTNSGLSSASAPASTAASTTPAG